MADFEIVDTLQDLYHEEVTNKVDSSFGLLAPARYVPSRNSKYYTPTADGVIMARESGFDPKVGMSVNSPAREFSRGLEHKFTDIEIFREFAFCERVTSSEILSVTGSSLPDLRTKQLAWFNADRLEWLTSDVYANAANFAHSDNVDFSAGATQVLAILQAVIDKIRPGNSESDNVGINMVLGSATAAKLRAVLGSTLGGNGAQILVGRHLEAYLQDTFGANVSVFQGRSVYQDNVAAAPGRKAMWDPDYFSLTATAKSSELSRSFAHTVILDQAAIQSMGANAEQLSADGDIRLGAIWAEDIANPRGVNVYAEAEFKVEPLSKDLGAFLTVTG